jgi:L-ascorbate metabolism protein UlaG (beta-lactamase superfamily)
VQITLIGHSTLIIEANGQRIITDPCFSTSGNPAYERVNPPAQTREEAARDLTLALLSHNHWDHVDRLFFRALPDSVPIVAPRQTTWLTRWQGAKNVVGLHTWESHQFSGMKVTAVPASHSAVTIGFVIESDGRHVYFAGDTFYRPFMKEIRQQFALDVALMPVTTYRLPMTMGEKEAVRAVRDLMPQVVIPIHLGIRPRSPLLRTDETPEGFECRVQEAGLPTRVVHLREGETWRAEGGI